MSTTTQTPAPAPARKRHPVRDAVLIGLVAAIGGISVSLALHSGHPAATVPGQAAAAPAAPVTTAGLGHPFTVTTTHLGGDPWYTLTITATRITEPADPDPAAAMPGGANLTAARPGWHLAAIRLTWTTLTADDGKGVTPSSLIEFSARAADGRHYRPSLGTGTGDSIDNAPAADPGVSSSGTVCFEIPDGTRVTAVTYEPLGAGHPVTWQAGRLWLTSGSS